MLTKKMMMRPRTRTAEASARIMALLFALIATTPTPTTGFHQSAPHSSFSFSSSPPSSFCFGPSRRRHYHHPRNQRNNNINDKAALTHPRRQRQQFASTTSSRLKLSERSTLLTTATTTAVLDEKASLAVIDPAAIQAAATATSPALGEDEQDELVYNRQQQQQQSSSYQTGLLTIAFCTVVFGSFSPAFSAALHSSTGAGDSVGAPPVLLLNAVVSALAFLGIVVGGPALEKLVPEPETTATISNYNQKVEEDTSPATWLSSFWSSKTEQHQRAGLELGFWKFLGVTSNLYGLTLTSSDRGAFLMQLTTLMVPSYLALNGVQIAKQVQVAIGLALVGVFVFTMQPQEAAAGAAAAMTASNNMQWLGDILCVVAAAFYSTYDLRLFHWGKRVSPRKLITTKIFAQAAFSTMLCLGLGSNEAINYLSHADFAHQSWTLPAIILWSALMVNMMVPYFQVSGQQAVGPTVAQTFYATQPLIAAMLGYVFLGETIHGWQGWVGGGAFCVALLLAASADPPEETRTNMAAASAVVGEAAEDDDDYEEGQQAVFDNVEVEMSKIINATNSKVVRC